MNDKPQNLPRRITFEKNPSLSGFNEADQFAIQLYGYVGENPTIDPDLVINAISGINDLTSKITHRGYRALNNMLIEGDWSTGTYVAIRRAIDKLAGNRKVELEKPPMPSGPKILKKRLHRVKKSAAEQITGPAATKKPAKAPPRKKSADIISRSWEQLTPDQAVFRDHCEELFQVCTWFHKANASTPAQEKKDDFENQFADMLKRIQRALDAEGKVVTLVALRHLNEAAKLPIKGIRGRLRALMAILIEKGKENPDLKQELERYRARQDNAEKPSSESQSAPAAPQAGIVKSAGGRPVADGPV